MSGDWYLVQTRGGQQERAKIHLENQSIIVYMPLVKVQDLDHFIIEPVFAGYLFVNIDTSVKSVARINSTRGVLKMVTFGQIPARVSDQVIDDLHGRFDDEAVINAYPVSGDTVEITQGAMKGLSAIYAEPDKNKRSTLLITLLGKQQRFKVRNDSFRKIV